MNNAIYDTRFGGTFPEGPSSRMRLLAWLPSALLAAVLTGCMSYSGNPLPQQPEWPRASFVSGQPLTVDQVVAAALEHSPDVRKARNELAVAAAKRYADDLLPDPQLSWSKSFPGAQGFVPEFMAGISYEVSALITHPAIERAAYSDYQQHQLALQWVQWQVANRAYQLFVTSIGLERLQERTEALLTWQQTYRDRMQSAFVRGDVTRDAAYQAEAGYLDGRQHLNVLRQNRLKAQQDLTALLALPPGEVLALAAPPDAQTIPPEAVQLALADLPRRRPDLQALAAGYAAQDERYRAAILGQFPRLEIGLTRGRDTSAIYASGFTVSVALPVFNRNRGNIAIEKATRDGLRDEYAQRLKDASAAVQATMSELTMLDAQLQDAKSAERLLEQSLETTTRAYNRRDADLATLSDITSRLLAQRIATTQLENSTLQLQATLCTLIGVSAIDYQPLQRDRS